MRFLALFWGLLVTSQVVLTLRFDREKVFRVKPQNENQVMFLKDLAAKVQLDFWKPDSVHHIGIGTDVDFRVTSDQTSYVQTMLEQNRTHYEILFHDLQEEIEKQFDGGIHFHKKHSYTRYNDWEKIAAWTERMAKIYPKLISRLEIGKTYENRTMYLLKVGKESGRKKAIFMECGVHAREWISPAFCQWFVKQAARRYGKDKVMTKLLDNLNFYVLPVFNIDGYAWTWKKDRMWRKNRAKTSNSECIGVDLNRNFKAHWGSDTEFFAHEPCMEVYCGPSAESEPETKAVTNFIRDHIFIIKGYISVHSYSQLLLFPYGYSEKQAPNHDTLNEVAKGAVDALSSLYNTKYKYGPIATTIYPCSGSTVDWAYDEGIKDSYVFELRDQGRHGFLLPESKIRPTCKETMLAVQYIANHILTSAP
ncbi:mast cell carboxypeptidase A-like isoform X1 [Sceloporus undulatus]|uniref:mast cell carboxypeptidase A-like isoform X1 n=2 Tax=Sceloporus undulatus TaxID=8520 RepID=UPI001C4C53A5|nr:mast cell carboxypeptidase A-like isoform X1 [Sceloporus undulatus]